MIAKYTSLSGNIAVHVISIFHRSLQTNLKNESIQIIVIHPYNLVTSTRKKSRSVRKRMVHIKNWRWSVQPLHLVVLTRFPRWHYKKLHVISTRKILLKTILSMRILVTVLRKFSQCTYWIWKKNHGLIYKLDLLIIVCKIEYALVDKWVRVQTATHHYLSRKLSSLLLCFGAKRENSRDETLLISRWLPLLLLPADVFCT